MFNIWTSESNFFNLTTADSLVQWFSVGHKVSARGPGEKYEVKLSELILFGGNNVNVLMISFKPLFH